MIHVLVGQERSIRSVVAESKSSCTFLSSDHFDFHWNSRTGRCNYIVHRRYSDVRLLHTYVIMIANLKIIKTIGDCLQIIRWLYLYLTN